MTAGITATDRYTTATIIITTILLQGTLTGNSQTGRVIITGQTPAELKDASRSRYQEEITIQW